MTGRAITSFWGRLWRDRGGGPIIELALLAPLLVSLGLGVNEFGNAVQGYHVIDKGVRDAARYLGKGFATCSGGAAGTVTASGATAAKNLAMYGNTSGSGNLVLPYWNDPNSITIGVSCVATSGGNPAWISPDGSSQVAIITVSAAVPYAGFGFLAVLGLGSPEFDLQHQEVSLPE
jgi:TadE-like protein